MNCVFIGEVRTADKYYTLVDTENVIRATIQRRFPISAHPDGKSEII